jgi:hypothetical protein
MTRRLGTTLTRRPSVPSSRRSRRPPGKGRAEAFPVFIVSGALRLVRDMRDAGTPSKSLGVAPTFLSGPGDRPGDVSPSGGLDQRVLVLAEVVGASWASGVTLYDFPNIRGRPDRRHSSPVSRLDRGCWRADHAPAVVAVVPGGRRVHGGVHGEGRSLRVGAPGRPLRARADDTTSSKTAIRGCFINNDSS